MSGSAGLYLVVLHATGWDARCLDCTTAHKRAQPGPVKIPKRGRHMVCVWQPPIRGICLH